MSNHKVKLKALLKEGGIYFALTLVTIAIIGYMQGWQIGVMCTGVAIITFLATVFTYAREVKVLRDYTNELDDLVDNIVMADPISIEELRAIKALRQWDNERIVSNS